MRFWWWFRGTFSADCLRFGRHYALWFNRRRMWSCTCGKLSSTKFGWTGEDNL